MHPLISTVSSRCFPNTPAAISLIAAATVMLSGQTCYVYIHWLSVDVQLYFLRTFLLRPVISVLPFTYHARRPLTLSHIDDLHSYRETFCCQRWKNDVHVELCIPH